MQVKSLCFLNNTMVVLFISVVPVLNNLQYTAANSRSRLQSIGSWLFDNNGVIAAEESKLVFHDCGGRNALIHLKSMKIKPGVFKLPGSVSVTAKLTIDEDIEEPIQSDLRMRKDIPYVGFVEIPCVKSFGSCTYNNICDMLKLGKDNSELVQKNSTNACAWVKAFGLPCECPLRKGTYVANKVNLPLEGSLLPEWIETGRYNADFKILRHNNIIACCSISFTIQ